MTFISQVLLLLLFIPIGMIYLVWKIEPEIPLFITHFGCLTFIFGFMWFITLTVIKLPNLYFS